MNKTTKRAFAVIPVIALFLAASIFLMYLFAANGALWSSHKANAHVFSSGQLTNAGSVYDSFGVTLAYSSNGNRIYNSNTSIRRSTLHAVGDMSGVISTGAQSAYKKYLTGYSFINGIYSLKKYGSGNDVYLSLSAAACSAALSALNGYNGAVGAYNYKTGELLCNVSAPTYDINNVPSDLYTNPKYDGVFLNRLFSGVYTPGSVMKIITAVCAIENIPDISTRTFVCNGKINIGGSDIICMSTHGEITFSQALNKSCNCAFAEISKMLGKQKLTATANALGFNTALKADGINLAISTFDLSKANEHFVSWAGVGQYETLLNPCHMMMIAGAIANNGSGLSPSVISKVVSPSGITVFKSSSPMSSVTMNPSTAVALRSLLRSNVELQYGDSRFPNLKMCGKTGTAEIDGKASHSWFVGFSLREDFPVAVVVVAENAGSGSGIAINTANAVLQSLLSVF